MSQQLIADMTSIADLAVSSPDPLKTLTAGDDALHYRMASVTLPMYVSTDADARKASAAASEELEQASVKLLGRLDVYAALKGQEVDEQRRRLWTKTLESYERQGCGIQDEAQRRRLSEINQRLASLIVQFQAALNDENTRLSFSVAELDGCDADWIAGLDDDKDKAGNKIVTLKYTDMFPVLKTCHVAATRAAVDHANANKCPDNVAVIEEALSLRLEAAKLLGFASHNDFILSQRMAKTPERVQEFLSDLSARLTPVAKAEVQTLLALKEVVCKERGKDFDGQLHSHDWRYLQELHAKRTLDIDQEAIKKYFPLDRCLTSMFELYQSLFHLRFEEVAKTDPNFNVWHEDVRQFDTFDSDTGSHLGTFFLDLHPRDGKYGHACVMPMVPTYLTDDGKRSPIVNTMICNFSKPTGQRPSLLYHQEVVTLFHEFGHAVHGLVSMAPHSRFSGTSVERDFVEAPSQFLENWCWDTRFLGSMSKHVDSGEPLPASLLDAMIKAKNVDAGIFNKRQLFFALIDQRIHSATWDAGKDNTSQLWKKMWVEETGIGAPPGNGIASFGHLMGGYSSSYYGYLYSQVYSADLFAQFENNIFDEQLGQKYRQEILAPGGSRDSLESLQRFLGREPNNIAFLTSIGLTE